VTELVLEAAAAASIRFGLKSRQMLWLVLGMGLLHAALKSVVKLTPLLSCKCFAFVCVLSVF
jgi:hypothetical protein